MRGRMWVACFLALALSACSQGPTVAYGCTRKGCASGLAVTFDGVAPDSTTITARTAGGDVRTKLCGVDYRCNGVVFFEDFEPDSAEIIITSKRGQTTQEVHPQYKPVYPNGVLCGAACSAGTVKVQLP
ncbi:MAG: hypothetical protein LJF06_06420 [Gemmatimonadetes bacterium]|nr:hypothetical protein [Gemmatimonadota bacterium]